MTIVVIARWQTSADALDEVLGHIAELRARSSEEPGCLGYEVFQSVSEPTTIVLVERYRDGAAQEAHRQSAHYQELVVARIVPALTRRDVEIVREATV